MGLSTTNVREDEYYYTEEFKTLMRSHREFLIANTPPATETNTSLLFAYRFDFFRYIKKKGVEPKFWWLCAYLSDITTPYQDISRMEKWYRPNPEQIEQIIARNNTVNN